MTKEQANKIKKWRETMTFRRISERAAEEWPGKLGMIPGNQIDGINLCKESVEVIGEWDYW